MFICKRRRCFEFFLYTWENKRTMKSEKRKIEKETKKTKKEESKLIIENILKKKGTK